MSTAPGVVNVRLPGAAQDVQAAARLPGCAAATVSGLTLIEMSQPNPNRRDAGERVYLTIRITIPRLRRASAQPPSNSPAPRSLQGGPCHDNH